ncbi:MAG: hypothetical protein NT038_04470 [Euryarchaeota archaeon]|nr:hypothetical protein [Euryarchaeota archaeon]
MKKKIFIGSIGAVIIVILMSFTSVISAQTIKQSIQLKIQNIKEKLNENTLDAWFPGYFFIKMYEYLKDHNLYPLIQTAALLIGAFINVNADLVKSEQWFLCFYPVIFLKILYGFFQSEYWHPGVLIKLFFQYLTEEQWFPGEVIYILFYLLLGIFLTGVLYYN